MEPILDQGSANQILARLMDDAQAAGALAAEAVIESASTVGLQAQSGRPSKPRRTQSIRLTGAVYLDGGQSAPFRADNLDQTKLTRVVTAAVRAAKKSAMQAEAGPVDRYDIATRGLGIEDPRYKTIDDGARADVLQSNLEACEGSQGIDISELHYGDSMITRTYASTRGVSVHCAETLYSLRLVARDRTTGRSMRHDANARHFADVGSLPYGVDLARRLTDLREEVPMPGGAPALVFDTRVMARVLELLAPAFCAPLKESGRSFLKDFTDRPIGHVRVHLIDDASIHGGLNSRAFDDRGVPPMPVPLIKEGALGGLYHDPESARRANARPTGHVIDGALRPANLVLRPGNRSRTQMLGEVPVSLCFDHIDGSMNHKTGRFTVSGPAFVLERGQRQGAVPEVVLTGHISELLSGVVEVASDQERNGRVDCATALIKGFPASTP